MFLYSLKKESSYSIGVSKWSFSGQLLVYLQPSSEYIQRSPDPVSTKTSRAYCLLHPKKKELRY